jgi:hypothetical protein
VSRSTTRAAALALGLALPGALLAQEGDPTPPKDPFSTPPAMRRAARAPADGGPRARSGALAGVVVRGTLAVRGRAPAALLEVEGRARVVRVGQTIELSSGRLELEGIVDGRLTVRWGPERERLELR